MCLYNSLQNCAWACTQLLSWFGVMMSAFFILLVLGLNKPDFWSTWMFKTEKIKYLIYRLRYLFSHGKKLTVCILEDTALLLWLLDLLRTSTESKHHFLIGPTFLQGCGWNFYMNQNYSQTRVYPFTYYIDFYSGYQIINGKLILDCLLEE